MALNYTGMSTTFRTLGQAGAITPPQTIFTLENLATSSVTVVIRRLVLQMDGTGALTAVMPQIKVGRFATPSTAVGTTLAKISFDSGQASSTLVQCRGGTASDGGAAVTVISPTATYMWQQYGFRLHTQVGQVLAPDFDLMPILVSDQNYTFKLLAGEGIGVYVVTATTASNPATNHYIVNCSWQEYL